MFVRFLLGSLTVVSARWVIQEPDVAVHDAASSSWVKGTRAPSDQIIDLTAVVRIEDDRRAELERTFWEVSNPKNENYGKYLSVEEIAKVLAVPEARLDRIRAHFESADVSSFVVAPSKDMITISGSVAALETALNTVLHTFTHQDRPEVEIIRASSTYSLPEELADDLVMVGELLQFPRLRSVHLDDVTVDAASWPNTCTSSTCAGDVTPSVLATRYQIDDELAYDATGNSMAVAEFQGQYFKPTDVSSFGTNCGIANNAVDNIIGGNGNSAGVEAELDIEYIKAIAPAVPLTVVYNSQYSLLSWANQITSLEDSPLVHSVSYSNDEAQQSSDAYMFSCNTAFMKAGVAGLSILFASGDQGVCGRLGCGYFGTLRFRPEFPGGSPYITVVGGTDFVTAGEIGDEKAWIDGGGGFSDTFDIPSYQSEAVAAYKARSDANLPPQAYWNNTGRGYPDVAALGGQGNPYCVYTGGRFAGVAGTSASCPVVAGVFARLNGLRLKAGKPAMGFLNPFIYQNPSAFQDVTTGINKETSNYGFTAVKGWDAATGFGTPNYKALASAAQSMFVQVEV